MTKIQSRLPEIGDTIFSEMSALAKRHQAINLGQGFPDYQPPAELLSLVVDAMMHGNNQYAPMAGLPELRAAITHKVQAQHGHAYDAETEVTVTAGATEALMSTLLALAHPGDEVLLIDPAYDLYAPAIKLAGACAVRVPMQAPSPSVRKFRIDWNAVEAALTSRTRLLVLNFPHNPTGLILSESDLDALEAIVVRQPLLLVSDEAYEHLVFDGAEHLSPVRRPTLTDRCILICSFGKSFHATGWRIGYCCAPAPIMREIRKVHQFTVFSANTPTQAGVAAYLRGPNVLAALPGFYQAKRDRLVAGLQGTALNPLHSSGTFFLLVDTRALGTAPEKELAVRITQEAGVASIPVSAFYSCPDVPAANHQLLRLCFAKQDATLDAAIERLRTLQAPLAG